MILRSLSRSGLCLITPPTHGSFKCFILVLVLALSFPLASCAPPTSTQTRHPVQARTGAPTPLSMRKTANNFPGIDSLPNAPRIALVIGNNAYQSPSWSPLKLAGNDANAVGSALERRGFMLVGGRVQHDVSAQQLRQLVDDTERAVRAKPGAVVVVYFSGHGFVDQGHNYLAPVGAPPRAQAAEVSVSVADMAQRLHAAGSKLTSIFLDSCRDYDGGHGGGLTDEAVPDNTFVGFAAQFGTTTASEPVATRSLGYYATALITNLDKQFAHLDDFHLAVSADVLVDTIARQAPVFHQADRMPTTDNRLTQTQPNVERTANQCIAGADLRLIFSDPDLQKHFTKLTMAFGPPYSLRDVEEIEGNCISAFNSGRRDIGILRGLGMASLTQVAAFNRADFPVEADMSLALLTQAAERGDPLANAFLAFVTAIDENVLVFGLPSKSPSENIPRFCIAFVSSIVLTPTAETPTRSG